jgi:hypothetical protein
MISQKEAYNDIGSITSAAEYKANNPSLDYFVTNIRQAEEKLGFIYNIHSKGYREADRGNNGNTFDPKYADEGNKPKDIYDKIRGYDNKLADIVKLYDLILKFYDRTYTHRQYGQGTQSETHD